ncbi:RING-type domain-containing protein [Pseudoscourfieldia marina]
MSYECPICLDAEALAEAPVSLNCGHSFCRTCIEQHCATNALDCPTCRARLPRGGLPADNVFLRDVLAERLAATAKVAPTTRATTSAAAAAAPTTRAATTATAKATTATATATATVEATTNSAPAPATRATAATARATRATTAAAAAAVAVKEEPQGSALVGRRVWRILHKHGVRAMGKVARAEAKGYLIVYENALFDDEMVTHAEVRESLVDDEDLGVHAITRYMFTRRGAGARGSHSSTISEVLGGSVQTTVPTTRDGPSKYNKCNYYVACLLDWQSTVPPRPGAAGELLGDQLAKDDVVPIFVTRRLKSAKGHGRRWEYCGNYRRVDDDGVEEMYVYKRMSDAEKEVWVHGIAAKYKVPPEQMRAIFESRADSVVSCPIAFVNYDERLYAALVAKEKELFGL